MGEVDLDVDPLCCILSLDLDTCIPFLCRKPVFPKGRPKRRERKRMEERRREGRVSKAQGKGKYIESF